MQCLLNIRGRLSYIDLYNSRKLTIVYTKSPMFIQQYPTLRGGVIGSSYHDNGHKKKEFREIMTQFLDLYMQMSHSKLPFFRYNKTNSACPSGTMP